MTEEYSKNLEFFDYIIVGSGPAGIQMGYYLEKMGVNYIILERGPNCSNFFRIYPRHRNLISVNKYYCGSKENNIYNMRKENSLRYDWNSLLTFDNDETVVFSDFSKEYYPKADCLIDYFEAFIDKNNINCRYNIDVINIEKDTNNAFIINTTSTTFLCTKLFIATGLTPKNIELPENHKYRHKFYNYSKMLLDSDVYNNKTITIIGGGNAAFETANFVNKYANKLTLCGAERFAWKTHYPGNIRSINMPIIDSYYLKLRVNLDWTQKNYARTDSKYLNYIEQLQDDNSYIWKNNDMVIYCGGFKPNLHFLEKIQYEKDTNTGFPKTNPFFESINIKNLYFLGCLTQLHDYKHGTSAFIHGFRYNARLTYQYIHNLFEYAKISYNDIAGLILKNINQSSALLHRFDIFSDYIFLTQSNNTYYYRHLPSDLVYNPKTMWESLQNKALYKTDYILRVTLGYDQRNTFNETFSQPQTGSPLHKDSSVFIHPIITLYKVDSDKNILHNIYSLHLPENAFNEFIGLRYHKKLLLLFMSIIELNYKKSIDDMLRAISTYNLLIRIDFLHNFKDITHLEDYL